MIEDKKIAVTVCTPTYSLIKNSGFKLSKVIGCFLTIIFVCDLLLLISGVYFALANQMAGWFRNLILAGLFGAIFATAAVMLVVDILTSIEENARAVRESVEKSEEHLYNLLLVSGKRHGS